MHSAILTTLASTTSFYVFFSEPSRLQQASELRREVRRQRSTTLQAYPPLVSLNLLSLFNSIVVGMARLRKGASWAQSSVWAIGSLAMALYEKLQMGIRCEPVSIERDA